jgi:hypothetical protein
MSESSREPAKPVLTPDQLKDLRLNLEDLLFLHPWGRRLGDLAEELGKPDWKSYRDLVPVECDDLIELAKIGCSEFARIRNPSPYGEEDAWARDLVMAEMLKHPGGIYLPLDRVADELVEGLYFRRTDERLAGRSLGQVSESFETALVELIEAGRIVIRRNLAFAAEFALAPVKGEGE